MLQQTRVEAVVPYYERWLDRFPDTAALAGAEEHEVLKAWEGLGYYARARNLHRAARRVRERHGGELPADAAKLRALPGIGDYTAGAIASIAFDIAAPAVDGNVRRVLARLLDRGALARAELRTRAAELVDPARPGDYNQALMELGATICLPRTPRCNACPVADHCRARARGTQHLRPAKHRRATVAERVFGTAIVRTPDGRLLLRRRPGNGLLGGLWEFPGDVATDGESALDAARRAAASLLADGLAAGHEPLAAIEHTFSHFHARYQPFTLVPRSQSLAAQTEAVWFAPGELDGLALPKAQRTLAWRVTQLATSD